MTRRIDVHHHYIPPAYLQGRLFTLNALRDWDDINKVLW